MSESKKIDAEILTVFMLYYNYCDYDKVVRITPIKYFKHIIKKWHVWIE